MLPQTLPAGATVEVVFVNANNEERTLTASIGNTEWKMGTTVTYKLSYEMSIDVPTDAQDAHYITFPITVNVKDYRRRMDTDFQPYDRCILHPDQDRLA